MGEKLGSDSKSVPLVKRLGLPLGSFFIQIKPKALKAIVFPSGEVTVFLMTFDVNSSVKTGVSNSTVLAILMVASALKEYY